jgi:hypothetical protein
MSESLSPARQALQQAQAHREACVERANRIRAARERSWSLVGQAADAVEAAERNLAAARRSATAAVLQELLENDAAPALSVADAESALAAARSRLTAAQHAVTTLADEDAIAQGALDTASRRVRDAIGQVLIDENVTEGLLAEYEAALDRVADLKAVLHILPKSQRQMDRAAISIRNGTGRGLTRFKDCLAALEHSADTALPDIGVLDAEPEREAARDAA